MTLILGKLTEPSELVKKIKERVMKMEKKY